MIAAVIDAMVAAGDGLVRLILLGTLAAVVGIGLLALALLSGLEKSQVLDEDSEQPDSPPTEEP